MVFFAFAFREWIAQLLFIKHEAVSADAAP
jgi:hypothetical protein